MVWCVLSVLKITMDYFITIHNSYSSNFARRISLSCYHDDRRNMIHSDNHLFGISADS